MKYNAAVTDAFSSRRNPIVTFPLKPLTETNASLVASLFGGGRDRGRTHLFTSDSFRCVFWRSSLYLVRQLHNYKLKQSKATGFGLFVLRPSSGYLPGLNKGQDLEPFYRVYRQCLSYIMYYPHKNFWSLPTKSYKQTHVSFTYTLLTILCILSPRLCRLIFLYFILSIW
jgi:hypothetical protein